MRDDFYVYIHCKKTDDQPFYVGKGTGRRAYNFTSRNNHWKNVAKKHGVSVYIFKSNMYEKDAFELERNIISEIGIENLTNMTEGGEGTSGVDNKRQKEIYTSDGEYFFSVKDAAIYFSGSEDLYQSAQSYISLCANGTVRQAYGRCFSYISFKDAINERDRRNSILIEKNRKGNIFVNGKPCKNIRDACAYAYRNLGVKLTLDQIKKSINTCTPINGITFSL